MRNLVLVAQTAGSFSLLLMLLFVLHACVDVQPVLTDCYVWPEEGDKAYSEIQAVCGGEDMPNCPAHKEWRARLRNLKNQLDACKPKEL